MSGERDLLRKGGYRMKGSGTCARFGRNETYSPMAHSTDTLIGQ